MSGPLVACLALRLLGPEAVSAPDSTPTEPIPAALDSTPTEPIPTAPIPTAPIPAPASAPIPAPASAGPTTPYLVRAKVRRHQFNFVLEGGGGARFTQGDGARGTGFGRLTLGAAHLRDRVYVSEGAFYEISSLSLATFGLHVDVMVPSRLFFDFGPSIDIERRLGAHAGIGWGIFGIEAQVRQGLDGPPSAMVLAKLCVIGFIMSHKAKIPEKGGSMSGAT